MACHCIDLPFLFGNFEAWPDAAMLEGIDPGLGQAISVRFRGAVAAFAHAGEPWPRYDTADRLTMVFGTITGPVRDPAGAAWRDVFTTRKESCL